VSVGSAPPPPSTAVFQAGAPAPVQDAEGPTPEGCPLCGAPLLPEQEWCLRCGAAARTRLAMSSSWKGPIVAVAIVVAVSLAVLAVSLISLAGSSSTKTTATVSVVTSGGTATATGTTATATSTATTNITGYPGTASGPLSKEPTVTPPPGAPPTTLQVNDLIVGTGPEAKAGDTLTVNYVGVLFASGTEFDSSWKRHGRFTFTLGAGHVIAGWDQGIGGMKVGGRRELVVPASLAYGAQGFATVPPIPPNAALVFVVDLIAVSGPPAPAATKAPAAGTSPAKPTSTSTSPSPSTVAKLHELEAEAHASPSKAEKKALRRQEELLIAGR
jgi:peptidylprolyl isomerase